MNIWLLGIVTLCYTGTGIDYCLRGQPAWGIMWIAYAVALVAFLFATHNVPHP